MPCKTTDCKELITTKSLKNQVEWRVVFEPTAREQEIIRAKIGLLELAQAAQ